jgi:hypothetical protein
MPTPMTIPNRLIGCSSLCGTTSLSPNREARSQLPREVKAVTSVKFSNHTPNGSHARTCTPNSAFDSIHHVPPSDCTQALITFEPVPGV